MNLLARTDRKEHCLPDHKSFRVIEILQGIRRNTNINSPLPRFSKPRLFQELTKIPGPSNSKQWKNLLKFNINLRKERASHKEKFLQQGLKYLQADNSKEILPRPETEAIRILQPTKMK